MLIELASVGAALNVAKTFVGIGGLIFVHELGHFLVGRWCGVHPEAFSIGFGPVLLKWRGKPKWPDRPDQTTEYRLSAVPLGGYVKFLGENPDERGDRDPRSFHAATYPRKVAIMLAGVTMNLLAAFVMFATTFVVGWETAPPVVGDVPPGYPAWEHGIRKGDEFVSIDGRRTIDFMDVKQETIFAKEITVLLRRDGVERTLLIPTRDSGEGIRAIGVDPATWPDGRIGVEPDGAAAKAGFATGDHVVAVNGKPVANLLEATRVHAEAEKDTVWTVDRGGTRMDLTLPWRTNPHPKIGVELRPDSDHIVVRAEGPAAAAGLERGDRPVSVGGVATKSATRFAKAIEDASATGALVVRRGDREISVNLPEPQKREEFARSVAPDLSGPVHAWLLPGPGAARDGGLPDGVEIVEIDDRRVVAAPDVQDAVKKAFDEHRATSIKWRDVDGREGTIAVTPIDVPDPDLGGLAEVYQTRTYQEANPFVAAGLAFDRTGRWITRIFSTLGSVFSGGISGSKLSGPIMIAKGTYKSAENSWGDLLMFLGMISMNLAVLNVLPLPLLDGGQLAVHTIERVRGRPISERVLEGVQWTGLVLLLSLMIYVIRNDVLNLMHS